MTILVYKDGRRLIDNEQPLEGVSLDNLAAFLSNPKDGDVVKYDEKSGMWIAGEAGGGSSGGGVLVVHQTVSGTTYTLDKTWKEIRDAMKVGVVVMEVESYNDSNVMETYVIYDASYKGEGDFEILSSYGIYVAEAQNDYPFFTD